MHNKILFTIQHLYSEWRQKRLIMDNIDLVSVSWSINLIIDLWPKQSVSTFKGGLKEERQRSFQVKFLCPINAVAQSRGVSFSSLLLCLGKGKKEINSLPLTVQIVEN